MSHRDEPPAAVAFFGRELRRAREAAGMTQEQLAVLLNYSRSAVGNVESAQRAPSREFAQRCDAVLKLDGLLTRIYDELIKGVRMPPWIAALVDAEQQAVFIRTFEPSLIPGLLQTEDYARAVLNQGRITNADDDEINERVATRLGRQQILNNGHLRGYHVVLDESALHRVVGGRKIMRDALGHVLDMMRSHRIEVQVLPFSAGAHPGDCGSFVILDLNDSATVVHLDGPAGGTTTGDPSTVEDCRQRFEGLRAQALSPTDSLCVIEKRIEELQ